MDSTPTPTWTEHLTDALRRRDLPGALLLAARYGPNITRAALDAVGPALVSLDSLTPRHNGTDTSRAAAESVAPRFGTATRRVLDAIADSPSGLTDEEIERLLHLRHQSASSARNALMNGQWIEQARDPETQAPITRPNETGRKAKVWVLTSKAARLGISVGTDDF